MDVHTTVLVLDDLFQHHLVPVGHPERPQRITAIRSALEKKGLLTRCKAVRPSEAAEEWLTTVHDPGYLRRLKDACAAGDELIDSSDCALSERTYSVARSVCGGLLEAADRVFEGTAKNAFVVGRPPGHHAERDRAMGFCFINHIAILARCLQRRYTLERILIVDWDVHHGNGTQHAFEEDPAVFYCSLHGHPLTLYPGTGFATEQGRGAGEGATLNVPFYPNTADEEYLRGWREIVLPAIRSYRPEVVLVSAGFDAHRDDPLGTLALTEESFRIMTADLLELAAQNCGGKLISLLEGGYDLQALGSCAAEHLKLLLSA